MNAPRIGSLEHTFSCYEECARTPCLGRDCPNVVANLRTVAAYDHTNDSPPHTHGGTDAPECTTCRTVGGEA